MGSDSVNTRAAIPGKHNIDGAELYGEDGQTILELENLSSEEVKKLLKEDE